MFVELKCNKEYFLTQLVRIVVATGAKLIVAFVWWKGKEEQDIKSGNRRTSTDGYFALNSMKAQKQQGLIGSWKSWVLKGEEKCTVQSHSCINLTSLLNFDPLLSPVDESQPELNEFTL